MVEGRDAAGCPTMHKAGTPRPRVIWPQISVLSNPGLDTEKNKQLLMPTDGDLMHVRGELGTLYRFPMGDFSDVLGDSLELTTFQLAADWLTI